MKYIAFYDIKEYEFEHRSVALCATNLTDYILEVLNDFTDVEIISPSRTRNKKGFYKSRTNQISEKTKLIQPPTFGVRTPIGRVIAVFFTFSWLFFYLLRNTKKGETIMAYHSLSTMVPIRLVKKLRKINLILEVREFYSDARQCYDEYKKSTDKLHKKEMQYFSIADKYIFPTEILNNIVNTENKPYVISPGIYKSEKRFPNNHWNDNKIHVVYAGTLRKSKGAFFAIDVAEYLSKNYHVHLLGSDKLNSIPEIKKEIHRVSQLTEATISFDGQLKGKDFKRFLQRCQIGLSPQNSDAAFNNTSFPSKVFTYFANGLDVVSVRIPTIEQSPVGEYIYYYKNDSIEDFANVIMSVNQNEKVDKAKLLNDLDKKLRSDLKTLVMQ